MKFNFANLFFKSCKQFADRTAIYSQNIFYTYRQLFERTKNIYSLLKEHDIKENYIGVYALLDNVDTAASILAISAYGAAYVPINPKFPDDRNRFIVQDCDLKIILSQY